MKKYEIKYLVSAVEPDQWPSPNRLEVAILGRSNAGKSSLINALWGKPVAFTSSTPGKTQVLNFYDVGPSYRVVDSPGYGFSKKAAQLEAGFQGIETYLSTRTVLRGLILVADANREPESEEKWVIDFSQRSSIPLAIALNKVDKLNQKEVARQKVKWEKIATHVFFVSARGKTGVEELEAHIYKNWILPKGVTK